MGDDPAAWIDDFRPELRWLAAKQLAARPKIRIWVYMKQVTFPSLLFPIFALLPHFTLLAWSASVGGSQPSLILLPR